MFTHNPDGKMKDKYQAMLVESNYCLCIYVCTHVFIVSYGPRHLCTFLLILFKIAFFQDLMQILVENAREHSEQQELLCGW